MPAWEGGAQWGSSKVAAKTRQQLLEQAHADRDARKTERVKHQCATRIQCCWRSYQARVLSLQAVCPARVLSEGMFAAHQCIAVLATRNLPCRSVSKSLGSIEMPYLSLDQVAGPASLYQHANCSMTSLSSSPLRATGTAMGTFTKERSRASARKICRPPCPRHCP